MLNKEKGITLIALIITIIVMLILVGVTINVALNGGLFKKAETATRETEEKAILEEMLAMMELTDDGKIDYTKIKDKMILKYDGATYSYPNITIPGKWGTYKYALSETEIKIGTETGKKEIDADLKKYILGADGKGRNMDDIIYTTDYGKTATFLDDPSTPDVNEATDLDIEYLIGRINNEDASKMLGYIKYKNEVYRVTIDFKAYYTGDPIKLEDLDLVYTPKGNEGKDLGEVTGNSIYNGWTILYDNGNTFEAVSPTAQGEIVFGSRSGTDVRDEAQLEEMIESYNDAINIINNYCKNDLTGLPQNIGIRSVGSATEISSNDVYSSPNLATWSSSHNGVVKKGDLLFEDDFIRMTYHGVLATGESYLIASRNVTEDEDGVEFNIRTIYNGNLSDFRIWMVKPSDIFGSGGSCKVRPIITVNK